MHRNNLPLRTSTPMLLWFPCCRFSFVKPIGVQFFILWWLFSHFRSLVIIFTGSLIFTSVSSRNSVFSFGRLQFFPLCLYKMWISWSFLIGVWESFGHFMRSNRYFSYLYFPLSTSYILCLSMELIEGVFGIPFLSFLRLHLFCDSVYH